MSNFLQPSGLGRDSVTRYDAILFGGLPTPSQPPSLVSSQRGLPCRFGNGSGVRIITTRGTCLPVSSLLSLRGWERSPGEVTCGQVRWAGSATHQSSTCGSVVVWVTRGLRVWSLSASAGLRVGDCMARGLRASSCYTVGLEEEHQRRCLTGSYPGEGKRHESIGLFQDSTP